MLQCEHSNPARDGGGGGGGGGTAWSSDYMNEPTNESFSHVRYNNIRIRVF